MNKTNVIVVEKSRTSLKVQNLERMFELGKILQYESFGKTL